MPDQTPSRRGMALPSGGWWRAVTASRATFIRLTVVTGLILVFFSLANPSVFLARSNIQFVLLVSAEVALLALAISLTMLTAGIDLSVVGIANLSAVFAASVMVDTSSVIAGIVTSLAVAMACGLLNGALIAFGRVPPILATLGTSQLFLGLALVHTNGAVVKGLPQGFTDAALRTVVGVPLITVVMLLVAALVALLVGRTAPGFAMRMVGASAGVADFTGLRRQAVLMLTYLVSGTIAGVAGLIITARASGADSQYGTSYILLAIVIAVLAGVDPDGGYLTVAGVVVATIAMQALSSGLLSLDFTSQQVRIAQGLLLIAMVALNAWGGTLRERLGAALGAKRGAVT